MHLEIFTIFWGKKVIWIVIEKTDKQQYEKRFTFQYFMNKNNS